MRKDENDNECPATLGEYRELCAAIGGEDCEAVAFLDRKIEREHAAMPVLAPDSQMREILMPLLVIKARSNVG